MTFEEYLRELADPSVRLKVAGLARLSGLSREEWERFALVWPTVEAPRRRQVMQELVELAEDNVELNFDAVFFQALGDADAAVRIEAVQGLWEYEGKDLIGPLLQMLETDDNPAVRAQVALALGRFALLAALGKLRERYLEKVEAGLRRVVEDEGEVEEVRARALEAIAPVTAPWVREAIRSAYDVGTRRLKVSALHAMGRSCEVRWLPVLVEELSSEDPELRFEAATACGALADERVVPHLAPLLEDPDGEVKEATIAALGEIGGRRAKQLLLGLAQDPSPGVREAALEALGKADFSEEPMSFRYQI